jgi:two-component system LytT family response regulator
MNSRYKTILVEDESLARQRLKKLLSAHEDSIELIGEATDGEEGLVLAESLKPDLIFLDIQMPVKDGFEMLQQLHHKAKIIFTTAFDQYAIKAFEENSIDYLLKPIEKDRLAKSIQKLKRLDQKNHTHELEQLLSKLNTKSIDTLSVKLGDKIILVSVKEISYFHAEDKYVFAAHDSGKRHLLNSSLSDLEKTLPDSFIRIHRSYIINSSFIKEIRKGVNGKLDFVMKTAEQTPMSISSSQTYTPIVRKQLGL